MTSKICIKCLPPLTTSDQDYQQHLQKNKVQFRTLAVHIPMQLYQRRKTLHFFWQYTSRDENETSKFPGEGRKNTLKSISWRQSKWARSLRRSNVREIRFRLCYNSRKYQQHSPEQRYVRTERPSEKIMQIGTTCQRYNIGKVYVSSILSSARTFSNISQINKVIKRIMS